MKEQIQFISKISGIEYTRSLIKPVFSKRFAYGALFALSTSLVYRYYKDNSNTFKNIYGNISDIYIRFMTPKTEYPEYLKLVSDCKAEQTEQIPVNQSTILKEPAKAPTPENLPDEPIKPVRRKGKSKVS